MATRASASTATAKSLEMTKIMGSIWHGNKDGKTQIREWTAAMKQYVCPDCHDHRLRPYVTELESKVERLKKGLVKLTYRDSISMVNGCDVDAEKLLSAVFPQAVRK
jgi:hypothetical protein